MINRGIDMKFILNESMVGINGVEKISLKEVIEKFLSLSFALEKLYLNDKIYIKVGEEAKKVISKLKKYLEENYKSLNYKYEANEYSGSYYFKDLDLTIFFEKYGRKKIVDRIDISLPYEDNTNISEVGKILGIEILKQIL